ncbi:MAG: hypothetical protein U1D55_03945 [Phycisphaerae bacterium]
MTIPILVLLLQSTDANPPRALARAQEARLELRGANLRWRVLDFRANKKTPRETFHAGRIAWNGDLCYENRGDANGVLQYDHQGAPEILTSHGVLMKANGETWQCFRDNNNANFWKSDRVDDWRELAPFVDIRTLGLGLRFGESKILGRDDLLAFDETPLRYEQSEHDGEFVVTATNSRGARIEWRINPAKGWNVERVTLFGSSGAERQRAVVRVKQYGDKTWFPESVSYFGGRGAAELESTVEIGDATFFAPDAPNELTPTLIGVEPGAAVTGQKGALDNAKLMRWDGDRVVTGREWTEAVAAGLKKPGPAVARAERGEFSRIMRIGKAKVSDLGLWERYVQAFIRRYELDSEQSERAWNVHAECVRKANQYLEQNRAELDVLDRTVTTQPSADKLAQLLAPLDKIFNEDLRPRLHQLLTRSQRRMFGDPGADDPH